MKNLIALEIGDKVFTQSPGEFVKHYGIFIGAHFPHGSAIVHNDKRSGNVRVSSVEEFAQGSNIHIERREFDQARRRSAAVRALSLVGAPYDLFRFNCEHLANYAQSGVAWSDQLKLATGIGLVAFLFAISKR